MGLFKNDKKPCPICGSATPRILSTKIEDEPICKACAERISMEPDLKNRLTLDGLREHFAYLDENAKLLNSFNESKTIDLGMFSDEFIFDEEQGLFYVKNMFSNMVFRFSEVTGFSIKEDEFAIFKGDAKGFTSSVSPVANQVASIANSVNFSRALDALDGKIDNDIRTEAPFDDFNIEITLKNPYWHRLEVTVGAPSLGNPPDAYEYLSEYNEEIALLNDLANTLASNCFSASPISQSHDLSSASLDFEDPVEEIKKYKELLDSGIITAEEFNAKKKQIMGI